MLQEPRLQWLPTCPCHDPQLRSGGGGGRGSGDHTLPCGLTRAKCPSALGLGSASEPVLGRWRLQGGASTGAESRSRSPRGLWPGGWSQPPSAITSPWAQLLCSAVCSLRLGTKGFKVPCPPHSLSPRSFWSPQSPRSRAWPVWRAAEALVGQQ